MNAIAPGLLRPTALTMLSGFVIIIAATLALGSMAQDQSGHSAAMVSKSFRTALRGNDDEFELITPVHEPAPDSAVTTPPLPGRFVLSFGQVKEKVDPASEFANLLTELDRIANRCISELPVREIRIDVFESDAQSIMSTITRTCDALSSAESVIAGDGMQLEFQKWAASPTPVAWIDAVRDASSLCDRVDTEFSKTRSPPIEFCSSAALWPHADKVRPSLTLVVRFSMKKTPPTQ